MLKKTKTRDAVLEFLKNANTPVSAYDIYSELMHSDITLSSIYRTLDTFSKSGLIRKENNNVGTSIYTIIKDSHCHFLECKKCHSKIKLDYCPYHKSNEQIFKNTNFLVDEHNVIIYGVCSKCSSKGQNTHEHYE